MYVLRAIKGQFSFILIPLDYIWLLKAILPSFFHELDSALMSPFLLALEKPKFFTKLWGFHFNPSHFWHAEQERASSLNCIDRKVYLLLIGMPCRRRYQHRKKATWCMCQEDESVDEVRKCMTLMITLCPLVINYTDHEPTTDVLPLHTTKTIT